MKKSQVRIPVSLAQTIPQTNVAYQTAPQSPSTGLTADRGPGSDDAANQHVDEEGNELVSSSVEIPASLRSVLKPHQIEGIHFLWKRLVDNGLLPTCAQSFSANVVRRVELRQDVFGCVLGHSMGLGKTVTTLSFLLLLQAYVMLMSVKRASATMLNNTSSSSASRPVPATALRIMIVCPRSTTPHWQQTFAEWMKPQLFGRVALPVWVPSGAKGRVLVDMLRGYNEKGGVLLTGYEELISILTLIKRSSRQPQHQQSYMNESIPFVPSFLDNIRQSLPSPAHVRLLNVLESADIVVLDESHRLKRVNSRLFSELQEHLRSIQLRVALTGTPFQNHLEEYNVMSSIVTGKYLDSQRFKQHFVLPIQRGQCSDCTFDQFREMQQCVIALRRHFASTVHRKGPEVLERELPSRQECVIFLDLSEKQETTYKALAEQYETLAATEDNSTLLSKLMKTASGYQQRASVIQFQQMSAHLFCHPDLYSAIRRRNNPDFASNTESSSGKVPPNAYPRKVGLSNQDANGGDAENATGTEDVDDGFTRVDEGDEDESNEIGSSDFHAGGGRSNMSWLPDNLDLNRIDISDSPKLRLCIDLIHHIVKSQREKVVVFSTYLSHLSLLEFLLKDRESIASLVFTGSHDVATRKQIIDTFNGRSEGSPSVLLCSTRAGGVGVNLTGANHCILFDCSWNPSDDTQATYRLYRYGQQKSVFIYRLSTFATSEHVVFFYALRKSWVQKKIADVADPTRQERHMKEKYFTYPCGLPIEDGTERIEKAFDDDVKRAGVDTTASELAATADVSALSPTCRKLRQILLEQKRKFFLHICSKLFPVLHMTSQSGAFNAVRSFTRHSFLLRDDSVEAIKEIERKFKEEEELKKAMRMPQIIVDPRHSEDARRTALPTDARRCFAMCEPELQQQLHAIADNLLLCALDGCKAITTERREAVNSSAGKETTANLRITENQLCTILSPLLGKDTSATRLVEMMFAAFRCGVQDLLSSTLNDPAYFRVRTLFASRLSGLGKDGGSTANIHKSRNGNDRHSSGADSQQGKENNHSTTTTDELEYVLLYRTLSFLSRFAPDQLSITLLECGFIREFVPQCVIAGITHLTVKAVLALSEGESEREKDTDTGNGIRGGGGESYRTQDQTTSISSRARSAADALAFAQQLKQKLTLTFALESNFGTGSCEDPIYLFHSWLPHKIQTVLDGDVDRMSSNHRAYNTHRHPRGLQSSLQLQDARSRLVASHLPPSTSSTILEAMNCDNTVTRAANLAVSAVHWCIMMRIDDANRPFHNFALPRPATNTHNLPRHEYLFVLGHRRRWKECQAIITTFLQENFPDGLLSIADAARMLQLSVKGYGALRVWDKKERRYRKCGTPMFQCPRCRAGTIGVPTVSEPMQCAQCHYNLEFEVRYDSKFHHLATLYTFITLTTAIDSFDVLDILEFVEQEKGHQGLRLLQRSDGTEQTDANDALRPAEVTATTANPGALHWILRLFASRRSFDERDKNETSASVTNAAQHNPHHRHDASKCFSVLAVELLVEGIAAMCRRVPASLVHAIGLECGAKSLEDLQLMFVVNSDYAWRRVVGKHVREAINKICQALLVGHSTGEGDEATAYGTSSPFARAFPLQAEDQLTIPVGYGGTVHSRRGSVPELFIIMALCDAIYVSKLSDASQLIRDGNVSDSFPTQDFSTHGNNTSEAQPGTVAWINSSGEMSRKKAERLLRCVADSVVKWIFAKQLLADPLPPVVQAFNTEEAWRSDSYSTSNESQFTNGDGDHSDNEKYPGKSMFAMRKRYVTRLKRDGSASDSMSDTFSQPSSAWVSSAGNSPRYGQQDDNGGEVAPHRVKDGQSRNGDDDADYIPQSIGDDVAKAGTGNPPSVDRNESAAGKGRNDGGARAGVRHDADEALSDLSSLHSCYSDNEHVADSSVQRERYGSDVDYDFFLSNEKRSDEYDLSCKGADYYDREEEQIRQNARLAYAESVRAHRANLYWLSYMEVYGTDEAIHASKRNSTTSPTGAGNIAPPDAVFWATQKSSANRRGMSLMAVVDAFLSLLLNHVGQVSLIDLSKDLKRTDSMSSSSSNTTAARTRNAKRKRSRTREQQK